MKIVLLFYFRCFYLDCFFEIIYWQVMHFLWNLILRFLFVFIYFIFLYFHHLFFIIRSILKFTYIHSYLLQDHIFFYFHFVPLGLISQCIVMNLEFKYSNSNLKIPRFLTNYHESTCYMFVWHCYVLVLMIFNLHLISSKRIV